MAITKAGHRLEGARFLFDEQGDVSGVVVAVNFALQDGDVEITRARVEQDVWGDLTQAERAAVDQAGKLLLEAAAQL